MYYTVQTLMSLGKNVSQIARELKMDRKTARKIINKVKSGNIEPPFIERKSIIDVQQILRASLKNLILKKECSVGSLTTL